MNRYERIGPSSQYLERISPLFFDSLKRAENGIYVWFPTGAKTTSLTSLLALVRKGRNKALNNHEVIYIDTSSVHEQLLFPLLNFINDKLPNKSSKKNTEQNELSFIHNTLTPNLISLSKKKDITLVIDKLETYPETEIIKILRVLDFLQSRDSNRVHVQIHVRRHSRWPKIVFENKITSLAQNVYYVPLPTEEEAKTAVTQFLKRNNINISPSTLKILTAVCGSHPMLLRSALRLVERGLGPITATSLLASSEILERARLTWSEISEEDRQATLEILKGEGIRTEAGKHLFDIGFIRKNAGALDINGIVFQRISYISQPDGNPEIFMTETINKTRFLSSSEKRLLLHIASHENSLCTRDELAEVIWGADALSRYSNWAIDRTISRIRAKLPLLGFSIDSLKTVRRKGYRWSL